MNYSFDEIRPKNMKGWKIYFNFYLLKSSKKNQRLKTSEETFKNIFYFVNI